VASLGIDIDVLRASNDAEIAAAFAGLPKQTGTALVFGPGRYIYTIARVSPRWRLSTVPTALHVRDYVDARGLSSCGADYLNVMQLTGGYTAGILKDEKPDDLPFLLPTKFEMMSNLKTTKRSAWTCHTRCWLSPMMRSNDDAVCCTA
jgi:putative tryptophan/tyrosine transport system substrate-binding protein